MKNNFLLNLILAFFIIKSTFAFYANFSYKKISKELKELESKTSNQNKNNIKFKGMTFVGDKYCPFVNFNDPLALQSLENLKNTGSNWIAIVVTEYQDYKNSTEIYPVYDNFITNDYFIYKTESIDGLVNVIRKSKQLGLKVMLKPHIDLSREPLYNVTWRGNIGETFTTEEEWSAWFNSYEKFILKYAILAEKLNVEMFSASCELIAISKNTKHWRELIPKIRKVYNGILTDSANHDGEEYDKTWWDQMDYIGVDAYYLPIKNNDLEFSKENFEEILQNAVMKLKALSKKFNKDVIITEVGFCSGNCKREEKIKLKDQYLQAYFYERFMEVFSKEDFIKGFFWWAWNSDPYFGGEDDMCISPQNKLSEYVIRKFYGGDVDKVNYKSDKRAICPCTI
jgi:hypothetical protein